MIVAATLFFVVIYFIFFQNDNAAIQMKPSISVAALSIKEINENSIDADARLLISNPLPLDVVTNRLEYQVSINGTAIMQNSQAEPVTIRSDTNTFVELPVKILSKKLVAVLDRISKEEADSADYTISARFYLNLPIAGTTVLDFTETKKLPALRMPGIRIGDLSLDRLRWEGSSLTVDAEVKNTNDFPLQFKDVRYDLVIGDDLTMSDDIRGITKIPSNGMATVPIELHTKHKELLKMAWKTLFEDDETPFVVTYKSTLISKNDILDETPLVMKTNGTLADLKKLPPRKEN